MGVRGHEFLERLGMGLQGIREGVSSDYRETVCCGHQLTSQCHKLICPTKTIDMRLTANKFSKIAPTKFGHDFWTNVWFKPQRAYICSADLQLPCAFVEGLALGN